MTMELTEVWRQADQTFISLLQAVRLGRCVLGAVGLEGHERGSPGSGP